MIIIKNQHLKKKINDVISYIIKNSKQQKQSSNTITKTFEYIVQYSIMSDKKSIMVAQYSYLPYVNQHSYLPYVNQHHFIHHSSAIYVFYKNILRITIKSEKTTTYEIFNKKEVDDLINDIKERCAVSFFKK